MRRLARACAIRQLHQCTHVPSNPSSARSIPHIRVKGSRPTFASQSFTPYESSKLAPAMTMLEMNWTLSQSLPSWCDSMQNSADVAMVRKGACGSIA
mmetsp:Transcript_22555/g.57688  ORF Transcript_22555/g.57688 Transcript_22555/m.57688 type:complete len:97 (-) Transcript_22555:140-430(-)